MEFRVYIVRCGSKKTPKRHVFEGNWTTYSNYGNYSRLKHQHDWEDLHDQLVSMRLLILIKKKEIFVWIPKKLRQMATCTFWMC
jgi:hypothetical protein